MSLKLITSLLRQNIIFFKWESKIYFSIFTKYIYIYVILFKKNRAHRKLLPFLRRLAINGVGANHFAVSHIYVHLIDWRRFFSQERSPSGREETISWSRTCRVPTRVVGPARSQDLSRRINWNERVSVPPPLAFTWNMKILLRPVVWITTLNADTFSFTQRRTTYTNVDGIARSKSREIKFHTLSYDYMCIFADFFNSKKNNVYIIQKVKSLHT